MPEDSYALGRDYIAAARLNLQHFLWKQTLGYCLHPDIPTSGENLHVADVGTGTGSWLFDVAQQLPPSSQFKGFDISEAQFTQKEWLPSNISFHIQDATRAPPQHLLEQFDIVHLRLFLAVVDNNDPTIILDHCLKLLSQGKPFVKAQTSHELIENFVSEPGGYLQWDETDSDKTEVVGTHDVGSAHNFRGFLEAIRSYKSMQWVANLPTSFENYGLQNVVVQARREQLWQRKMFNEMHCILAEEYVASLLARAGPAAVGEERRLLARNMYEEVQRGLGWSSVSQVVVGRKPL